MEILQKSKSKDITKNLSMRKDKPYGELGHPEG